jgi:hypothetical protein
MQIVIINFILQAVIINFVIQVMNINFTIQVEITDLLELVNFIAIIMFYLAQYFINFKFNFSSIIKFVIHFRFIY